MPRNPPATAWTLPTAASTYRKHKGIAEIVRELTDNGRTVIETLVSIATGPDSSDRDKVSASSILLDRGFGKAVETTLSLQVDASSSEALSQLADAELERLAQTLAPSAYRPVIVLPAQALSPTLDSLPDAPPEALEAPLRPLSPVTVPSGPVAGTPVDALPPPLARAPRRRIVVPRPPVSRQAGPDMTQDVVDRSDIDPKG